jgi:peptidoglycan/xylan/chitin deacetylase (PgdA/CDA1 family)
MYLGSVKFYKHLIYLIIVTVSILALIGLGYLISLIMPKEDAKSAVNLNNDIVAVDNIDKTDNNQETKSGDNTVSDNTDADKNDDEEQDDSDSSEQKSKEEINLDKEKQEEKNSEESALVGNFPNLYCESFEIIPTDNKTAYLTFDDGPSENTEKILEILKKYNIKATFFVITGEYNSKNLDLLEKINEEGHSIGIHSHSHDYNIIYDSLEAYLEDISNVSDAIYEKINIRPNIVRLPGGSINEYNQDIYQDIIDELAKRNFQYFDWNVSFNDAKNNTSIEGIHQSAMYGIEQNKEKNIIVLAHDQTKNSIALEALEKVINVLESHGYSFSGITNSVEPIAFLNKLEHEKNNK